MKFHRLFAAVTYLPCNRLCFRLGYGSCLENKPSEKNQSKYHGALPGEIYSVDKQCQMIFGEESRLCPYMVRIVGKKISAFCREFSQYFPVENVRKARICKEYLRLCLRGTALASVPLHFL